MLVRMNQRELTTESKSSRLSIMRFCRHGQPLSSPHEETPEKGPNPTYLTALLEQHLVVLAQRNAKDDGRHVLEAVNPLLALTPLPADIKHAAKPSVSANLGGGPPLCTHWMLSCPILNLVS